MALRMQKVRYLNEVGMQKMLYRLLFDKKMSKKELAEALGISVSNLNLLLYEKPVSRQALVAKINMPLIRLYCSTKFESRE